MLNTASISSNFSYFTLEGNLKIVLCQEFVQPQFSPVQRKQISHSQSLKQRIFVPRTPSHITYLPCRKGSLRGQRAWKNSPDWPRVWTVTPKGYVAEEPCLVCISLLLCGFPFCLAFEKMHALFCFKINVFPHNS